MKKTLAIVALGIALTAPAFATTTYTTDFESETSGQLASGWTLKTPFVEGNGPMTAVVADGPTGGKALKLVWGTDFASYPLEDPVKQSEGGIYSPELTGYDADNSVVSISYDLYRTNNGVHQWTYAGGTNFFSMWNWDTKPGNIQEGWITFSPIDYLPDNSWVHVNSMFDSSTNEWKTTITHAPKVQDGVTYTGCTMTGTSEDGITGFWSFEGNATNGSLAEGRDANGQPYANYLANETYIDNFSMSVTPVPEPGSILALGSGLIGLVGFGIRRKK